MSPGHWQDSPETTRFNAGSKDNRVLNGRKQVIGAPQVHDTVAEQIVHGQRKIRPEDQVHVGELLTGWREADSTYKPRVQERPTNYLALNKASVKAKIGQNPSELRKFREQHEHKSKRTVQSKPREKPKPGVPENLKDLRFGNRSAPETPVGLLIQEAYRHDWVHQKEMEQEQERLRREALGPSPEPRSRHKYGVTKASLLKAAAHGAEAQREKAQPKPRFVMKQFQNTPGRLHTGSKLDRRRSKETAASSTGNLQASNSSDVRQKPKKLDMSLLGQSSI